MKGGAKIMSLNSQSLRCVARKAGSVLTELARTIESPEECPNVLKAYKEFCEQFGKNFISSTYIAGRNLSVYETQIKGVVELDRKTAVVRIKKSLYILEYIDRVTVDFVHICSLNYGNDWYLYHDKNGEVVAYDLVNMRAITGDLPFKNGQIVEDMTCLRGYICEQIYSILLAPLDSEYLSLLTIFSSIMAFDLIPKDRAIDNKKWEYIHDLLTGKFKHLIAVEMLSDKSFNGKNIIRISIPGIRFAKIIVPLMDTCPSWVLKTIQYSLKPGTVVDKMSNEQTLENYMCIINLLQSRLVR